MNLRELIALTVLVTVVSVEALSLTAFALTPLTEIPHVVVLLIYFWVAGLYLLWRALGKFHTRVRRHINQSQTQ